jgi:hypothetical protein
VERDEVLHCELLLESCSGTLEKLRPRGSEDDVNVEQQVSSVGVTAVDEQRGVRLGLHEAQGDQVGGDAMVPHSRHLLQAVEGLVELTHQLRVRGVNEVGRLRAVHCLRECAMEEGVLDVELVHGSTSGDSQSQHSSDGGSLNDGVDGLVVVHPEALSEPPEDPMSLEPVKRDIHLELVLEDSLANDDIVPRRPRNQVSHVVRQQGLILLHSATPVGVRERATDRGRDRKQCRGSGGSGAVDDPHAW